MLGDPAPRERPVMVPFPPRTGFDQAVPAHQVSEPRRVDAQTPEIQGPVPPPALVAGKLVEESEQPGTLGPMPRKEVGRLRLDHHQLPVLPAHELHAPRVRGAEEIGVGDP